MLRRMGTHCHESGFPGLVSRERQRSVRGLYFLNLIFLIFYENEKNYFSFSLNFIKYNYKKSKIKI